MGLEKWLSYFKFGTLAYQGKEYFLTKEEVSGLYDKEPDGGLNYWHGEKDPSSGLAVDLYRLAQKKYPQLPEKVLLKLGAETFDITAEELYDYISWQEDYMRWHDGDPSYYVLESSRPKEDDTAL